MTCSHVASPNYQPVYQPAKCDSKDCRDIGRVLVSSTINFCDLNSSCNPNSSQGNMDAALVEILDGEDCAYGIHELGNVVKFKKLGDIQQGMKVEFNGRTTNGRKQLSIGGLCVSYKVAYEDDVSSKYACFTNLIELRSIPFKIFATNYYVQDSPVRKGDSGAWICSNDSDGYSWCGMLICGDIDRGYFLPSEHILNWLNKEGYSFEI